MLYALYFTACTLNGIVGTVDCQSRKHTFSEDVQTPMQCVTVAQAQLARWTETHPEFRITEWRCGAPLRVRSNRA